MIKNIPELVDAIGRIGETVKPEPEKPAETEDRVDPEKLLVELKQREAILNKLITEGNGTKDISEFRATLAATIDELEKILADPETDILSEKRPI